MEDVEKQVNDILNQNKIDDLNRFLSKRRCLNDSNQYMGYVFHLIQSAGILTVSIGQSYQNPMLTWIGVGLNTMASVIHIITADNKKVNKTLFHNIKNIKNNTYLDEAIIDTEDDKSLKGSNSGIVKLQPSTRFIKLDKPKTELENEIESMLVNENV